MDRDVVHGRWRDDVPVQGQVASGPGSARDRLHGGGTHGGPEFGAVELIRKLTDEAPGRCSGQPPMAIRRLCSD